jgi:hypothetical protein
MVITFLPDHCQAAEMALSVFLLRACFKAFCGQWAGTLARWLLRVI